MEKAYAAVKHTGCNSLAEVCIPPAPQQQPAGAQEEAQSLASRKNDVQAAAANRSPTAWAGPAENMHASSGQEAAHNASGESSGLALKRGRATFGVLDNNGACKRASLTGSKAQPAWTQCSSDTNDFTF